MPDLFERLASLRRADQPFAVATVVGRRAPVSSQLGDRAVILADGRMEGFVGGACSREIVRTQAMQALASGRARLVSIRPDVAADEPAEADHLVVRMSCASEGAVDVFVEPVLPALRLLVVGTTPVAEAVAALGRAMEYTVIRVVDSGERADAEAHVRAIGADLVELSTLAATARAAAGVTAAVVASQGHYDEMALEVLLPCGLSYVGLVASRARGATLRAYLAGRGVAGLDALRNPAGLDLGATGAAEVAVSILAEIVQQRAAARAAPRPTAAAVPATAVDPVCGMEVTIAAAKHTLEHEGAMFYFCCPHCRADFLKDPQAHLAARS